MSRVQTSPMTVPVRSVEVRTSVPQALAQTGRILADALNAERRAANRTHLIEMQTEWLGTISKLETDLESSPPADRVGLFAKGLKGFEPRIEAVADAELRDELRINFRRDAMRGTSRVQRTARRAIGQQANAARIGFEDQLTVQLERGAASIEDVTDRQAAEVDAMVTAGLMTADDAAVKKRSFQRRAVDSVYASILDSDLSVMDKVEAGTELLESDMAVGALAPDERLAKKQTLDGLINRHISILQRQSTAAGNTVNLLALDEIESELNTLPESPERALALLEVEADRARAVASLDDAGRLMELFAAGEPAGPNEPNSVQSRNAAYRTMRDNGSSLEAIGSWFASGDVDFPPDYTRDVRNLFDHGHGDFDLAAGISVHRAIASTDQDAADRLIADSSIKDVAQTAVRMAEILPEQEGYVVETLSRGEAGEDAKAAAGLLVGKDSTVNAESDISEAFDDVAGRTPDIVLHDTARRDWKAASIFRYVEARQVFGNTEDDGSLVPKMSRLGATDLKQRYNVVEEADLVSGTYDAFLVPKRIQVTPKLQTALGAFGSVMQSGLFGMIENGRLNAELITSHDGLELFPSVDQGQVNAIMVWDPATETSNVLMPGGAGFAPMRDAVMKRSSPAQRDVYYWLNWNEGFKSRYVIEHDPKLVSRLIQQARNELISVGAWPEDKAQAKQLLMARTESIARTKGWLGIQPENGP